MKLNLNVLTSLLIFVFISTATVESSDGPSLHNKEKSKDAAASLSDWPSDRYDAQRSSYNSIESELQPPFDETPITVNYNPNEIRTVSVVRATSNSQLIWKNNFLFQENTHFLASTDMTGNQQWLQAEPADATTTPYDVIIDGDTIYVTEFSFTGQALEEETALVARSLTTGVEKWRHISNTTNPNSNQTFGASVLDGDHIYVNWGEKNSNSDFISKLSKSDGSRLWTIEPENTGSQQADFIAVAPSGSGQNVLVVAHFNKVVGYSTVSGAELWEYDINGDSGLVNDVEDLLILNTTAYAIQDEALIALDIGTGAEVWRNNYESSCEKDGEPSLATDGSQLYVSGECIDELVAYAPTTGVEQWRRTIGRGLGNARQMAIANGYIYVDGFTDAEGSFVYAYDTSGQQAQSIKLADIYPENGLFVIIESLAVSNGQLLMGWLDVNRNGYLSIWGEGVGTGNLYLDQYDDDQLPATNPTEDAEVPLVKRDGNYGVEISVAAKVGNLPARFVVYDSNDNIYKEVTADPNPFGFAYFIAPLEYTAAGYEYQVILNSGDELPRRKIVFPSNPESNLEATVETSGLTWVSPPATITTAPTTLTANLPNGFPAGETQATLYLQESGRGTVTLDGERSGNQVVFTIDDDNGLNGEFVATAIAQAEKYTVFSDDLNLTINSPDLPDVRVQSTTAIIPQQDGTFAAYNYTFERERQVVDTATTADVQIASVVPDPAGYQVTLLVRTPAAIPTDPLTQKWEVSVRGVNTAGEVTSIVSEEINAEPDGIYLSLFLSQDATSPINRIEAFGATTEGATRLGQPSLRIPLAPAANGCSPNSPPPSDPSKPKDLKFSDVVNINGDLGVGAEAVYGGGISGAVYKQKELLTGQTQACIEAGVRAGGGVGGGPLGNLGLALNLRGSGHDAPASSGTKYDVTVKAGAGVQLSYSVPDNWGDGGYGTIGLGVGLAPEANVSIGETKYQCAPLPKETECCKGNSCESDPPPPPGNDHPDDTNSVVINRLSSNTAESGLDYWQQVLAFANREGYSELAEYALFRLADEDRVQNIGEYPVGEALTDAQLATVARQEAESVAEAALLAEKWETIEAQLDLLEASRANVLANGYYQQMSDMLNVYGIPNRFVTPDFSPDAIKDSLLVIPTAGLYGLTGDSTFAARLERFVDQGGTLLVMSQPEDDGFDLLPGSWNSVGYQNDQSCWVAAMTPTAEHPMLSSIDAATVKANVDGYLTSWPTTAEALLRRTKNNQGAFVLDQVGDGHMIVTNMYDDWGRTVGQSSNQVRNLFRDVARWALTADDNMPTTRLNQAIQLPVLLTNLSGSTATQVRYTVRDATGNVQSIGVPGTQTISLADAKSTEQTISVTPSVPVYGLWSVSYTLLDSSDNELTTETFSSYFALNGQTITRQANFEQFTQTVQVPQVPVDGTVTATVSFDKAAYAAGETVQASLNINVSGSSAGQLRINASLGGDTQEQTVSATSQTVTFSFTADFSGDGLFYFGIFDDGTDQGLYLDTSWVQPAGTSVTIVPDKVRYAPGETVTFDITGTYEGDLTIDGPDYGETLSITSGDTSATSTLPATAASGTYTAQYLEDGQLRQIHFDLAGPLVTVTQMGIDKTVAETAETVNVAANITTDQPLSVLIVGKMVDAQGNEVGVYSQSESLASGAQTVTMPVAVTASAAGTVRYDISILDGTDTSVVYGTASRYITLNAPQLLGLNTDGGFVPTDEKSVMIDFYSPSAQSVNLVVEVDGSEIFNQSVSLTAGFSQRSITLPSSLTAGGHTIIMQTTSGALSTTKSDTFVIADALPEAGSNIFLPFIVR
ncbi:MAG: PQQ-binding-like beta-propeller repeat protein [Chloroflexota bacterium]